MDVFRLWLDIRIEDMHRMCACMVLDGASTDAKFCQILEHTCGILIDRSINSFQTKASNRGFFSRALEKSEEVNSLCLEGLCQMDHSIQNH
jgi:hypothetical protein